MENKVNETDVKIEDIIAMREAGLSYGQIGNKIGMSRQAVQKRIARQDKPRANKVLRKRIPEFADYLDRNKKLLVDFFDEIGDKDAFRYRLYNDCFTLKEAFDIYVYTNGEVELHDVVRDEDILRRLAAYECVRDAKERGELCE